VVGLPKEFYGFVDAQNQVKQSFQLADIFFKSKLASLLKYFLNASWEACDSCR
jgi:hypothetical protein